MDSSYIQKKDIVINIILYERKQQAMKISSFLKNKINQNVKIKKYLLQQKIIEAIILIQKNIRAYFTNVNHMNNIYFSEYFQNKNKKISSPPKNFGKYIINSKKFPRIYNT